MDHSTIDTDGLVRMAQAFARFPSEQTAAFEQDRQVQAFLAGPVVDALDESGLAWRRDSGGGVIVELGQSAGGPTLMLVGYAMTHPANRMRDPFSGALTADGGQIRGRGLAEQKGALAAAIAATAAASRLPLKGRLVLAVTPAGETGRHDALKTTLSDLGHFPDLAVIAIGTSGRLALGNKGRIDIDVVVRGRSAHSSTPDVGIDAIEGARRVLEQLAVLGAAATSHAQFGKATLTPTAIRSWPEATHTIQDEVRLQFDRRLLPGEDVDLAFESVEKAAQLPSPWSVTVSRAAHMYPSQIEPAGVLARAVAAGCRAQGQPEPKHFYSHGALDAGLFSHVGKEAAMWGPGKMDTWHSDDEGIVVEELADGARGYLGLVRHLLT